MENLIINQDYMVLHTREVSHRRRTGPFNYRVDVNVWEIESFFQFFFNVLLILSMYINLIFHSQIMKIMSLILIFAMNHYLKF